LKVASVDGPYANDTVIYEYDQLGRVITVAVNGVANQRTRSFDSLGRVVSESPAVLRRMYYTYDAAANRIGEQIDDVSTLSTYDGLNRFGVQQAGGAIRVAGSTNEPATVAVNGKPMVTSATNAFGGAVTVGSGVSTLVITATDPSGNTQTQKYSVDLTGPGKTFAYDAKGNLTSDGTRTFEWDAEDRLSAVTLGSHRTECSYTGDHRRRGILEKTDGVITNDTRVI
jgi:hypothetical protein